MNVRAQARIFEDRVAEREQVPLHIGIMSPSGGGKTFSALRLATGIQAVLGGDIWGIDTENRRMLHYADRFKFRHIDFRPPFGSIDYLDVVKHCVGKGAKVIIVDSMTHEHIGEGGYLETAENTITRIAGDDYKKREACKMLGWAAAGPLRQKMIEGIKQLDGAFIWCFRAKEKAKPVRKNNKTEVIDLGFMPIAGDEWVYEMAANCMLFPRSNGVPTWRSDNVGERQMMKLPEQFKDVFIEGEPLSEEVGRRLAEWARGGKAVDREALRDMERRASEPPVPDWDDYVATWSGMINAAVDEVMAQSLVASWNSTHHKDLRKRIDWPEKSGTPAAVKELATKIGAKATAMKGVAPQPPADVDTDALVEA